MCTQRMKDGLYIEDYEGPMGILGMMKVFKIGLKRAKNGLIVKYLKDLHQLKKELVNQSA